MITTDAALLQAILEQQKPLSVRAAERLARYVSNDFDPDSDECWRVADKLWKGAMLARNVWRSIAPGVYAIHGHKIRTSCDGPPIPSQSSDWSAVTDSYEPGHPIGHGRTEQAAIDDLIALIGVRS